MRRNLKEQELTTEGDENTYAAVIAISLPGREDVVAAHIVLTPPDKLETAGRVIPLRECTLADIQDFAEELEAGVWETVRSIKLADLQSRDDVGVEVKVRDKKGQTVALNNWLQQSILLPAPDHDLEGEQTPEKEEAAPEAEEGEATEGIVLVEQRETAGREEEFAVTIEKSPAERRTEPAEAEPQVMVSATEPVFAEREAADDPHAFPTPAIVPSKARVRIAGKRLPPGYSTWAAVDILMDETAFRSAQAHALSSPDREVAGVLIGSQPEKQPDGRYVVHVIDTIIAKYTVMQGASVTYTPETWRYLNDRLADRYPDESAVMVGWYHTHPGFGIFLSGMDQFIHQNFFTQVWHVALVLDPIARKSGFFCWDRLQTRVGRYDFGWPAWAAGSW